MNIKMHYVTGVIFFAFLISALFFWNLCLEEEETEDITWNEFTDDSAKEPENEQTPQNDEEGKYALALDMGGEYLYKMENAALLPKNVSVLQKNDFLPAEKKKFFAPFSLGEVSCEDIDGTQEFTSLNGEKVREYKISLSPTLSSLSNLERLPEVGEVMELRLLNYPPFLFLVDYKKKESVSDLLMSAQQYDADGRLIMRYKDGELFVRLYDSTRAKVFNIFVASDSQTYRMREISCCDTVAEPGKGKM